MTLDKHQLIQGNAQVYQQTQYFSTSTTHPLVKILQNTLNTSQNTRSDTNQYPVLVIPRRVRQSPRGLNQRHQQTAEAYASERRGETSA